MPFPSVAKSTGSSFSFIYFLAVSYLLLFPRLRCDVFTSYTNAQADTNTCKRLHNARRPHDTSSCPILQLGVALFSFYSFCLIFNAAQRCPFIAWLTCALLPLCSLGMALYIYCTFSCVLPSLTWSLFCPWSGFIASGVFCFCFFSGNLFRNKLHWLCTPASLHFHQP